MKRRKRKGQNSQSRKGSDQHTINTATHPNAAGIDVGAEEFVVAVPPDRVEKPVRTYRTFTNGVLELRDWLLECKISTAAMESTGNYWITLYDTLTAAGIEVFLVNARHVKGVPGRKTDVCDAQWLQQLHAAGLLTKSFRPDLEIVPLRYLMRHRSELIRDSAKQIQLMQKSLTEMNLKLQHVFSDIDGVSAQAIIDAILEGERNPARLAALRDRRCRSSESDIIEALRGDYREEYLFVFRQSRELYTALQKKIAECDEKIGELIARVTCSPTEPLPELPPRRRTGKNDLGIDVVAEAYRFYGVNLSEVPGVASGLLSTLMTEVGTREQLLSAFPTVGHFTSWMGLCPDNRVSGGKVLKAETRHVKSRLAEAFRMAAFSLARSKTSMGAYVRRMKGKLGKAEGITAGGHKIARVVYGMIHNQQAYDPEIAFKLTPMNKARRFRSLERQAAALGFALTPSAA